MELKQSLEKACLSIIGLLLSVGQAQAQSLNKAENEGYSLLSGSLQLMTGQSDNGIKTYTDKIEDRQSSYGLTVNSRYSNSIIDFDADYQLQEQNFENDFQDSKTTLEGRASILLGKPTGSADMLISHSRSTLLKAPTQVNLTNNQEEREIFTIAPNLRARVSSSDRLQLTGDLTDIKFLESSLLNSTRHGVNLSWLHDISSIQRMQFSLQSVDIKFQHLMNVDYAMRQAMIDYQVKLRKVDYAIGLGYNQSEPEVGEAFNSPTYNIKLGYNAGLQEFSLSSSQIITDTSFGGGNGGASAGLPTSDGSGADNGRLKRQDSRLGWNTFSLCGRCSFSTAVFVQRDSYIETAGVQNLQTGGSLSFSYRFTDAASLNMTMNRSDMKFESDDSLSKDYDLTLARIEYSYSFRDGLSMTLQYEEELRKQVVKSQGYVERFLGVDLTYTF